MGQTPFLGEPREQLSLNLAAGSEGLSKGSKEDWKRSSRTQLQKVASYLNAQIKFYNNLTSLKTFHLKLNTACKNIFFAGASSNTVRSFSMARTMLFERILKAISPKLQVTRKTGEKMARFEDLEVWKRSARLSADLYKGKQWIQEAEELSKMLYGLIKSIRNHN